MSEIKAGSTDRSIDFVLLGATSNAPATGLTIADLDASYARTRSAAVKNDLTALSAVTDAHADNQAIEVHATFEPGVYRVDFPDAAFAAGADFVTLTITGAAIKPAHQRFALVGNTAEDVYTRLGAPAGASVSADVAAVKAETALIVADTNELQTDWANGGRLDVILDARASQASVDTIDGIVDSILVDTGTDMPATLATLATAANLAAVAGYLDTEIAAILQDTGAEIPALIAALPSAAGNATAVRAELATELARVDAAISTRLATAGYTAPDNASIAAILADTGTDGVVVADKTGFRLSSAGVDDILRTALTEGYAAEGETVTLEQALYMLLSVVFNRSVAGTTLTARRLDGTTPAMTFTLDDGTAPTSQVRAT